MDIDALAAEIALHFEGHSAIAYDKQHLLPDLARVAAKVAIDQLGAQPRAQGGVVRPRKDDDSLLVPLGNGCTYRIAGVEYSAQDALAKLNAKPPK